MHVCVSIPHDFPCIIARTSEQLPWNLRRKQKLKRACRNVLTRDRQSPQGCTTRLTERDWTKDKTRVQKKHDRSPVYLCTVSRTRLLWHVAQFCERAAAGYWKCRSRCRMRFELCIGSVTCFISVYFGCASEDIEAVHFTTISSPSAINVNKNPKEHGRGARAYTRAFAPAVRASWKQSTAVAEPATRSIDSPHFYRVTPNRNVPPEMIIRVVARTITSSGMWFHWTESKNTLPHYCRASEREVYKGRSECNRYGHFNNTKREQLFYWKVEATFQSLAQLFEKSLWYSRKILSNSNSELDYNYYETI